MLARTTVAWAALAFTALPVSALARAGALDPAFGNQGYVYTGIPAQAVASIAIQPDGKILIATAPNNGGSPTPTLVRLLPGGAPDTAFGTGGVAPITIAGLGAAPVVQQVVVQPDGAISFAVRVSPDNAPAFVGRFTPGGAPDSSFGNGGAVLGPVAYTANVMLVQGNGDIVVAGGSAFTGTSSIARLTSGGAFDPSFGSNGVVTITDRRRKSSTSRCKPTASTAARHKVARLLPNGAPDHNARGGTPAQLADKGRWRSTRPATKC